MYARGMTVREIRGHLEEFHGIDVSPDLISTVTDAVPETVTEWRNRALDPSYPIVFFDAIRVKIRPGKDPRRGLRAEQGGLCSTRHPAGRDQGDPGAVDRTDRGAKVWLRVMNELKHRGVEDILIAVVDGLKGFPDAITAVFPETTVQTCIVHPVRHSMSFASWKDRKGLVPALRAIHGATDADAGLAALDAFEAGEWGKARNQLAIIFGERFPKPSFSPRRPRQWLSPERSCGTLC